MPAENSPTRQGRLIRLSEMATRLGVDRVTVWRMVKRGTLPPPVHPTPAISAWFESDLDNVFQQLEEARRA